MRQKTRYKIEYKHLPTGTIEFVPEKGQPSKPMVFATPAEMKKYMEACKKTNGDQLQFRPIIETTYRREGEWI